MNAKKIVLSATMAIVPVTGALAQTDYEKDVTRTFVHERAADALDSVNSILCMFDQTKAGDPTLLNTGYYTALVDESLCEGRDDASKSEGNSSGGTSANDASSYNEFKVKSVRLKATDPQTTSIFVKVNGPNEMPMYIQGKMEITEGASEFNPLGAFTFNFKGSVPGVPLPIMKGMVKAQRDSLGRVVIKFAESTKMPGGPEVWAVRAALQRNTEGGAGSSYQKSMEEGMGGGGVSTSTLHFAYNKTNFKRRDQTKKAEVCLSRTSFETSAWRYGLYNKNTKARINVNSGFPINTQADGRGAFGFLSFHGLFLPPGADSLGNGDTVYRIERTSSGQVATPYTLLVKGGKLKRFVRSTIPLGSLKNIPLEGSSPLAGDAGQQSTKRLQWDGSQLKIVATASMSQSGPPTWSPVAPSIPINNQSVLTFGEIGVYSQALGGQARIQLENCQPVDNFNPMLGVRCDTPTADTTVLFFKESVVAPDDGTVPSNLRCYDNCPKATGSGMDKNDPAYPQDGSAHNYTFAAGLLSDGGNAAVLSEAPAGQPWGFGSGPLFEANSTNLQALACPWDPAQVCSWKAWSALGEFFIWETGPNNWNKYTSVMAADNSIVNFDPPLTVEYTYPTAGTGGVNPPAVDQKYKGNTFYLEYGGFGDLHGIPGKCFNPEDPADKSIDCSQPGRRWVPEFTIPAGSTASDSNGDSVYLIKPLEVEQRMAKVASSTCSAVTITDLSDEWPDLQKEWKDPNLGDEPEVPGAPKVVAGVLQ